MCAFDGCSVMHGDVAVRARVERAERLAALGHFARVVDASRVLCVIDRNGATGAADGVAVHISVIATNDVNAAAAADIVCLLTHCKNARSIVSKAKVSGTTN